MEKTALSVPKNNKKEPMTDTKRIILAINALEIAKEQLSKHREVKTIKYLNDILKLIY